MTEQQNDNDNDDVEIDESIERTDTGVSYEISITRGTGTRNQEKHKGKVKRRTVEELIDDAEDLKAYMKETARELRAFSPDAENEDAEDGGET